MLMSLPQKLFLGFWLFIVPNCMTESPLTWSVFLAHGSMLFVMCLAFSPSLTAKATLDLMPFVTIQSDMMSESDLFPSIIIRVAAVI